MRVKASSVSWEDLKQHVYYEDGSWRDIYVEKATREDWQNWADFVNANYPVVFANANGQYDKIDMAEVRQFWDSNGETTMSMAIFQVGGIGVKCHFFGEIEIENDIDPSEIMSLATHLQLMEYLKGVSKLLGKEVVLTEELTGWPAGLAYEPIIAVENDEVWVYPYWLGAESGFLGQSMK